jgi:Family of unknown function (DUF5709)
MTDRQDADTYHGYSVDVEDQPQSGGDSNSDNRGLSEPLDEGYSPPEKYSGVQRRGVTAQEEARGASLDDLLAEEEPEPDPYDEVAEDEVGEVGDRRAGRLVEADEGAHVDRDEEMFAVDVGIDGAAASAEEAAVHVIPDEDGTR